METNSLIIIIGTLFTLALILTGWVIIGFAQRSKSKAIAHSQRMKINRQQEIAENTLLSQERERQRLGLELHDDLGPVFASINVDLKRVRSFIEKEKYAKALSIAEETSSGLTDAVGKFSEVSRVLYPVIFNREGLKAAIMDIVENYNNKTNIKFSVKFSIEPIESELIELVIYRVVQELTTNAMKHSSASKVEINLIANEEMVDLSYVDNGVGFDHMQKSSGLGLNSIKGRVEAIGGSVNITTAIDQGLKVKIRIPNEKNSNS